MELQSPAQQEAADIAALVAGAPGVSETDIRTEAVVEQQFDNSEAVEADIKEYVGDGATDDTIASQEFVVPEFLKGSADTNAKDIQAAMLRTVFTQMCPTITGPIADTRASYQHHKQSLIESVVTLPNGLRGPRLYKPLLIPRMRRITKQGRFEIVSSKVHVGVEAPAA